MLHQHIIHFIRDWKKTGAVMPSSRYLARDAVQRVAEQLKKKDRDPVTILELGPGTGTFTERILPNMKEEDRLDIVELNSYFYNILQRRFRKYNGLRLFHQDFLKFFPQQKYDYVISSLPYESIPTPVIRRMWEHKLSLCKSDTYIIYYKYVNFNHFRCKFEKQLVRTHCFDEKIVFLNMPPARLFTLRIEDPKASQDIIREEIEKKQNSLKLNGRFKSFQQRRKQKNKKKKEGNSAAGHRPLRK